MFEQLGFENLNPTQASLILALILGLLFGAIAQHLKFCFRSAVVGTGNSAQTARGIWFITLGTALLGTQLLTVTGYISFDDHRLLASDLPVAAILVGGVMFGIGMVLTRGCISRLSVLTGSGNLRALTVLVVFAILAHATLKGILAPLRVWLGSVTLPMGEVSSLAGLPGGAAVWAVLLALICHLLQDWSHHVLDDLIGCVGIFRFEVLFCLICTVEMLLGFDLFMFLAISICFDEVFLQIWPCFVCLRFGIPSE
mgnify:CR=1 FL=1